MRNEWSFIGLVCCVLSTGMAAAEPDTFGLGTGRDGALTVTQPGMVINHYAQVKAPLAPGDIFVSVSSTEGFSAGDLVMLLQTTGIVPEPARGSSAPVLLSHDPVGRWELARVKLVDHGQLVLTAPLLFSYAGLVTQAIRVPEFTDVTVRPGASLVAVPWDGGQGGVLAFFADGTLRNEGELRASGAGFRGGQVSQRDGDYVGCINLPAIARMGAGRGEGVSFLDFGPHATGLDNASNGGGGGICPMSGGGGGGNGAAGGQGGDSVIRGDPLRDIGGRGGVGLSYSMFDHLTLGGGGGQGYAGVKSSGGAGGGAIFVRGYRLSGEGAIVADGAEGGTSSQGGAGGGGAGGSISVRFVDSLECGLLSARGGNGGSTQTGPQELAGLGGGGGGGRVLYQADQILSCPVSVEAGGEGWATTSHTAGSSGTVTRIESGFGKALTCPPAAPVFVTPVDGQVVSTKTPTIEVKLSDNSQMTVKIYVGLGDISGHSATFDSTTSTWKYTVTTALSELQSYVIKAGAFCPNQDFAFAQITIGVDATPPDTVFVAPLPPNPSDQDSATFSFQATNESRNVTFHCKLDDMQEVACGSTTGNGTVSYAVSSLSEGSHTFTVYGEDVAGNVETTAASYTWTVATLPETTLDSASVPSSPTNLTNATFTFSSPKTVAGFECSQDSSTFAACTSPMMYSSLSDGSHTFKVRAKDSLNRVDPTPAEFTWTVDTVPPDTRLDSKPANPSNESAPTFRFSATEASTFECQLDSASYGSCSSPFTLSSLADGSHTFSVRAQDIAGNPDSSPVSYTWTVDTDPPHTTIDDPKPSDPSNSSSATFTFSSTEPGTFECALDAAQYTACTSPKQLSALSQGSHTFSVRARDLATNVDPSPPSYTWTVDTLAPDTSIVQKPGNPSHSTDVTFTFSSTEAGGKFWCKLDASSEASCDTGSQGYSNLAEGVHTFCVSAEDAASNRDQTPACYTWVVDLTAPDSVLVNKPQTPTNATGAAFTFTGAGTGGKYWCNLDVAGETSCDSGSQTYASLTEGAHTFCVAAEDAAGNKDASPACYSWVIDLTAPDTSIGAASKPTNPTNSTAAAFTFTGAGPEGKYWCALDGGSEASCDSGSQAYAGLSEGTHAFCVAAQDAAGNKDGSPDCYSWVVDLTAPETAIEETSKPANPTNATSAIFVFSGAGSNGQYRCKLDDSPYEVCNFGSRPYSALPEGSHTFCVYAIDEAGNSDLSPACYVWVVDVTPPDTTILEASKPANPTNVTSGTFSFSGAGPGGKYWCKLDSNAEVSCNSGSMSYGPLPEGGHTFSVAAEDAAGNRDQTPASFSWQVDLTEPETTITSKPSNPSNSDSATFTFGDAGLNGKYWCHVDLAQYQPCDSGSQSYSSLAEGSHTFYVYAEDAAGNVDRTPATYAWVVDRTLPDTVIAPASEPSNPSKDPNVTFLFSGAGEGGTYQCKLDEGAETSCPTGSQEYRNLGEGTHTFCVYAIDAATNTDPEPACYTWVVDVTGPDTALDPSSEPKNPTNIRDVSFKFSGTGGAVKFFCKLDENALGECSSKTYDATGLAEGRHQFCVYGRDQAGNDDPSPACYDWDIDLTPPVTVIDSKPARDPINDRNAAFGFSGAGAGGKYWCKQDDGDASECVSPVSYANLLEGSHQFCVYAVDAATNADLTPECFTWTVDVTPPDTRIDSGKPPPVTNQTSVTFVFSGATQPGEGYRCKLDSGLEEVCDEGHKTYTGLGPGPHSFTVTADDAAQNRDLTPASYSWVIDLIAPSAEVSSPSVGKRTNNASFVFLGSASESLSQVEIFIDSLDAPEVTAADNSGAWSLGTAKVLSEGMHTVWARAIDLAGNEGEDSQKVTFIVDVTAPDTEVASAPAPVHNSRYASFVFRATGLDQGEEATFSCTVEALRTHVKVDGGCSNAAPAIDLVSLFGKDPNGDYELLVSAKDEAGNVDPSPASYKWTEIVTNPDPPRILNPADEDIVYDLNPTVAGTASPRGTVRLFIGDTDVGLTQVDAQGQWSFRFPDSLSEGSYSLYGVATDEALNSSDPSQPISFTVMAPKAQAQAIGGGLGCAASSPEPWLALLGLLSGTAWRSRRRRR